MAESLNILTINRGKLRFEIGPGLFIDASAEDMEQVCDDPTWARWPSHWKLVALRDALRERNLSFADILTSQMVRNRVALATAERTVVVMP